MNRNNPPGTPTPSPRSKKLPPGREAPVLRACLHLLHLRGVMAWRNNSGAHRTAAGGFVRYGKVGSPDILAILPPCGRLLAVECKRPGGKATEAQEAFLEAVRRSGGLALIIDDVKVLADALDALDPETQGGTAP